MKTDSTGPMPKKTKWMIAIAVVVFLYTVIGFFVVPAIVKSQLLHRLPPLTKRQVAIDGVKFNPYALSLTIDGLSLKETNGEVFSSFSELYVNFQLSSIFKRSWVFDEISLRDPFIQITYLKDGTFNFANLLTNSSQTAAAAPAATHAAPASIPPVIIYHLLITNAGVAFADLTRKEPFNVRYQPININLTRFTTLRDESSPYQIAATGDSGEQFGWSGNIAVNPLASSGKFALSGLKLKKFKPYSQDYARFEIADGQIDASAEYRYDSTTNALDLTVSNTSVTLSRFVLKAPGNGEEILNIPTLSVSGIRAGVMARTVEVGLVQSHGGSVLARRDHDGTINFVSYLVAQKKEAAAAAPAATPTPPAPPWKAKIDDIKFDDYAIHVQDEMPRHAADISIDQLAFDLKNISTESNAPVTLGLNLRLQKTGTVGVTGFGTLMPPSADAVIGVTNLDLRIGQPYLDEQLRMAIARGDLFVNGHAHYSGGKPGIPLIAFAGDVSVKNFAVTDEERFDALSTWSSLDISGIDLALSPDKFHVDRIKFTDPVTTVEMWPGKRFNFLAILPEKKAAAGQTNAPSAANAPAPPLPEITIGSLAFQNAALHFLDTTIEPNCSVSIEDSSGSVSNISSLVQTPAVVDVKGKVDKFSSFDISGGLNPMPDKLYTDVTVAFTNMGLIPMSPYTAKYAGRPLEKGKLSLFLHYKIDHRNLDAANEIFIDQLILGPKNNSTNATKMPVKLAIALLKDRNGRIKLHVPINGTLDNPDFHIWDRIKDVIWNVVVTAATSPFKLLGSMFGGGPELSYVAFDPGQAAIPRSETNKLNTLITALYNRPGLTMDINGSANPALDRDVMAHAKLEHQLKSMFNKELMAAGKPAVAVQDLKLEPADYTRLLTEAYTNAFGPLQPAGTNAQAILPKPAPAVHAEKPQPKRPKPFFVPGGERIVMEEHPQKPIRTRMPATPATNSAPAATAPVVAAAGDLPSMEARLLENIKVTDDDYRQLMRARADAVEAYLLKSGKVTVERLFITDPKPIGGDNKGEDRANLTLD